MGTCFGRSCSHHQACSKTEHMGSHIVRTPRYLFCFWAGLLMAAWAAETCRHRLINFIITYYWKLLCLDVNMHWLVVISKYKALFSKLFKEIYGSCIHFNIAGTHIRNKWLSDKNITSLQQEKYYTANCSDALPS